MLLILVAAVWLTVVLFGLTMCHLAALSDESHTAALAEWVAANRLTERRAGAPERTLPRLQLERQRGGYRAAG